ncbi:MAG: hypothetical protein HZB24_03220 [Desulfobacterales bacterium]|nr:hypothetical protein [Desulfobacterales bacterium]
MRRPIGILGFAVALAAVFLWVAAAAMAEKPSGNGKGNKHGGKKEYPSSQDDAQKGTGKGHSGSSGNGDGYENYFGGKDRAPIDRYYTEQFKAGKCPPGLAKKGNGCQPPGQAKKWRLHQPLPNDVIFHEVPAEVSVHLGMPPAGHRFVRVAQDILLIATGTGMVVDAMQDLGRELNR